MTCQHLQAVFVGLLVLLVRAQDEQIFGAGNCTLRDDNDEPCPFWADNHACVCAKSLSAPGGIEELAGGTEAEEVDEDDYGVAQMRDATHKDEIEQTMSAMKAYFKEWRSNPNRTESMQELLDNCKNKHEHCAFWKVLGECEKVRCTITLEMCVFANRYVQELTLLRIIESSLHASELCSCVSVLRDVVS
jgi:hypothetical protein